MKKRKKNALSDLLQRRFLLGAWELISAGASKSKKYRSSGIDSQTIENFSANLEKNLLDIEYELVNNTYKFGLLKPVLIPKSDGKVRLICVPNLRDRIVQKAFQLYLGTFPQYLLNNIVSYGFISGKGLQKAVKRAELLRNSHPYAYKTDISAFFDSISRDKLKLKIKQKIKQRSLHSILYAAVNCEVSTPTGYIRRQIMESTKVRRGKGIRQGMPLSPFLSNLILEEFDRAVIAQKYNMVRYADDLIIFADSLEECKNIHYFCKKQLLKQELNIDDINVGKTKVYNPDADADFLGLGLSLQKSGKYRCIITAGQQDKIKKKFFAFSDFGNLSTQGITITTFLKRLDSVRRGYSTAYYHCEDSSKTVFFSNMDNWVRNVKIKVYRDELGIKLKDLKPLKLKFLELIS